MHKGWIAAIQNTTMSEKVKSGRLSKEGPRRGQCKQRRKPEDTDPWGATFETGVKSGGRARPPPKKHKRAVLAITNEAQSNGEEKQ